MRPLFATGAFGRLWLLSLALVVGCAGDPNRPDQRFTDTQKIELPGEGPDALPRYCELLAGMRPDQLTNRDRLIRAVFYYRFHRMNALEVLHRLPPETQQRCRTLSDLEARHGRDADFLFLAFAEAVAVAREGTVDKAKVPEWVFEERERLISDFLASRAALGVLDPSQFAERIPAVFARALERQSFCRIAVLYQGLAWQRATVSGRSQELPRADIRALWTSLAEVLDALATVPDRTPEFASRMRHEALALHTQIERLPSLMTPRDAEIGPPAEFAVLDSRFHFREGRERVSMAIAEGNEGKGERAARFLLDALQHLLFAQQLALAEAHDRNEQRTHRPTVGDDENAGSLDDYLATIFANYNRITALER